MNIFRRWKLLARWQRFWHLTYYLQPHRLMIPAHCAVTMSTKTEGTILVACTCGKVWD